MAAVKGRIIIDRTIEAVKRPIPGVYPENQGPIIGSLPKVAWIMGWILSLIKGAKKKRPHIP